MEKIKIDNLSFSYPDGSPVIKNLSFCLEAGSFLTVIGPSGSGKSTLLSLIKPELAPKGRISGHIFIDGKELSALSPVESASAIGFVFQDPDKQLVTDKVWHELAFGMESLGLPSDTIRIRTAEVSSYLGIADLFERETHTLSGGQKQLLNLASVLCMNPSLLLLDEPTAQLDPIATEEFMEILGRLHRDTGITIILVEHRLESVAAHTDSLLILQPDHSYSFDRIKPSIKSLPCNAPILSAFPASVRLYKAVEKYVEGTDIPMTIAEGRRFIMDKIGKKTDFNASFPLPAPGSSGKNPPAICINDLTFSYQKQGSPVLRDLDLTIQEGEICTLLGGNGQGKSTLLQLIAGLLSPDYGHIKLLGKALKKYGKDQLYTLITMLPQQVETMFLKDTVAEELKNIPAPIFPMDAHMNTHPYDLSGGEKALLALNMVLSKDTRILLLDEPTKGLDTENKRIVAEALKKLSDKGITILLITHDVELAALLSHRIALLFDGQIASIAEPHQFFQNNYFYTTHFARMTKGIYSNVILENECIDTALKNIKNKATI